MGWFMNPSYSSSLSIKEKRFMLVIVRYCLNGVIMDRGSASTLLGTQWEAFVFNLIRFSFLEILYFIEDMEERTWKVGSEICVDVWLIVLRRWKNLSRLCFVSIHRYLSSVVMIEQPRLDMRVNTITFYSIMFINNRSISQWMHAFSFLLTSAHKVKKALHCADDNPPK